MSIQIGIFFELHRAKPPANSGPLLLLCRNSHGQLAYTFGMANHQRDIFFDPSSAVDASGKDRILAHPTRYQVLRWLALPTNGGEGRRSLS